MLCVWQKEFVGLTLDLMVFGEDLGWVCLDLSAKVELEVRVHAYFR